MIDLGLMMFALTLGGHDFDAAITAPTRSYTLAQATQIEDQTPTGKFTTATEVKPILQMTQANWVAVREFGGQDLVYFTHLMAWRCGLVGLAYSVNEGPLTAFPLPPCREDSPSPAALLPEDGLPYIAFPLRSVARVYVKLHYDDGTSADIRFERATILIP